MSTCIIQGCGNQLRPNARTVTCDTCRGNLHILERLRPSEVIERNRKQTKYRSRFDVIFSKIGERAAEVKFVDIHDLVEEKILYLPRRRVARSSSVVVPFKRRTA